MLITFETKPSEQYPGLLEITGKDDSGREYYLVSTPCGRILARPRTPVTAAIEPDVTFRKMPAGESV